MQYACQFSVPCHCASCVSDLVQGTWLLPLQSICVLQSALPNALFAFPACKSWDQVEAAVDFARRYDHMQQHTGTSHHTPVATLLHARPHPSSLLVKVPLQTHLQPRGPYDFSNNDQSDAIFVVCP